MSFFFLTFFFRFLFCLSILTFSVSRVRPEGACSDTLGAGLREEGCGLTLFFNSFFLRFLGWLFHSDLLCLSLSGGCVLAQKGRVSEQEGCGLTL